MGLDQVASGLTALFGAKPGQVNTGISFDRETYEKAKPFFLAGVQHFKDAANDVTVLMGKLIEALRDQFNMARETISAMKPYIVQFVRDVKAGTISLTEPAPKVERKAGDRKADQETAGQVAYEPKSKVGNVGTLVPRNLQTVTRDALDDLEGRVGDLDEFIAEKLGYDVEDIGRYFSAEQVDAVALGIDNIDKDAGFIIGDQTGVGKGRTVAAMIRYAMRQGKVPIFVTEKPGLYKDMYRDLSDIGMPETRILMTNAAETVALDDDGEKSLKTPDAGRHNRALMKLAVDLKGNPRALADAGYDVVFTTYSQLQPIAKDVTARIRFLDAIAADNFVILDESHNAGGTETKGRGKDGEEKEEELSRASIARDLIGKAASVFYSSATYAKRPQSMSLYFKTDMRLAVGNINQLAELISRGGVPMQQVVASMLSQAGQYIRRERSFAGVTYDARPVPVDTRVYDDFAHLINRIQHFSEKFVTGTVKKISTELKEDAKGASTDGSTGGAGATSVGFSSVMHNLIDQMLLAAKAKAAVDLAVEALERGEKPVLTVANTMGSFLEDYAEALGISTGDAIDINFNSLLERYLERTRWYTEKKPFMKKGEKGERKYISDRELGPEGVEAFKAVKKLIRETSLGTMPVSPIDYMASELRRRGYKVGEITGRGSFIDYQNDGTAYLRIRPEKERSTNGRLEAITKFNGGPASNPLPADQQLDVLILNQAGATGLSLHANAKFGNLSKRQMIIVQPEKNIDTHMQMLGRVHRTGQVVTPSYIQMVADVPAEKRPAAVLAKKMASLSANTTASRKGALSAEDVPDFMNEYGDQVAARVMQDNPEIHMALWEPLTSSKDGEFDEEGAIRKVTGYIPLLPLEQQLAVYEMLESEYKALIEQLDAAGENALEAKFVELDAKTLSREELAPARGGSKSPFAAGVDLEKVDVKRLGKPPSSAAIIDEAAEAAGAGKVEGSVQDRIKTVRKAGQEKMQTLFTETHKDFTAYRKLTLDEIEGDKQRDATRTKLDAALSRLRSLMIALPIGSGVRLRSGTAEGSVYGTVVGFKKTGKTANPAAAGSWKVTIQTLTAGRQTIPLSQLWPVGTEMATLPGRHFVVEPATTYNGRDIVEMYDELQNERREERFMVTGNLLAGFAQVNGKGSIVNYTNSEGEVRQGILLPREWDPKKASENQPVRLTTVQHVLDFLARAKSAVTSADGALTVFPFRGYDRAIIEAKGAKSEGGKYYLNRNLIDTIDRDFVKVGNVMRAEAPVSRMPEVIEQILQMTELRAPMERDLALEVTGKGKATPKAERVAKGERQAADTSGDRQPDPAVVEMLSTLVNRMTGGRAGLFVKNGRLFDQDGNEVKGLQWENFIAVTLAHGRGSSIRTIRHETIHVLRALGLFSDTEWATLTKAAARWRRDYDIDARYAGADEETLIEEAIAAAFAGENRPMGPVATVFKRISEFLKRLYRMLVSKDYASAEAILTRVERGEIGQRESAGIPDRSDEFLKLLDDVPRNPDGTFAVRTELAARVRKSSEDMARAVRELWKGEEVPADTAANDPPKAKDLNSFKRYLYTPATLFKSYPEIDRLIQEGIKVEIESSVWVNRLNERYTKIRKSLTDKEWGRVSEALWAGDEAQIDLTDEDLKDFGLEPNEIRAFRGITKILETVGRMVDKHRRNPKFLPAVARRKAAIENRMLDLTSSVRVMSNAEFKKKYTRRSYLGRRLREGKGDPVAILKEIDQINDELTAIRVSDPVLATQYAEAKAEYDALEARLAATSVRRRAGYVPHKFYGSWRLFEETGTDKDGNPTYREITSDQGFWDDKTAALEAARAYKKANPAAKLKIEPKKIAWPFQHEGTELSDKAYQRFIRNLEKNAGLTGDDLYDTVREVARKRFRRRIYAAGQYRKGAKGWERDIDRVMRTHIGQSIRYITMDKMKYDVINTQERMGISRNVTVDIDKRVLNAAFEQWWTDFNGQPQNIERMFDGFLNLKWATPLRTAMLTTAVTFGAASLWANPFLGAMLGGYLGYRMYQTQRHGGDFKTRHLTGAFLSDLSHLKLGLFVNVASAMVNLSQTALTTYPVLGEKWTGVGIQRASAALMLTATGWDVKKWREANPGKPLTQAMRDVLVLGRCDVETTFRFAETHPGIFKEEGRLRQASMWMFQKAETINRSVAVLGTMARADAAGKSHAQALAEARRVLVRTQFHGGNSNRPELLRNTVLRLPLQFKKWLVDVITFGFGLNIRELPRFLGAMVVVGGMLGLPGLQIIDAVYELVTKESIVQNMKDWALDKIVEGEATGTMASMLIRGWPGAFTDTTQRVGMGEKFLPSQWSDFSGPMVSTIWNARELAKQGAGITDHLRNLTGAAAPLKVLEAAANGMPIESLMSEPQMFWDALRDEKTLITNPYLKGAAEYSPTGAELFLKGMGFRPIREAHLGDIRSGTERGKEMRQRETRPVLAEMVRVWAMNGGEKGGAKAVAAAEEVAKKAIADGVQLSRDQIRTAFKDAVVERGVRDLKRTPKVLREDPAKRLEAVNNPFR